QFGGHKYAAGLTMEKENVGKFVDRFEKEVSARITEEMLVPEVEIDLELPIASIEMDLLTELKKFGPFGPGNMAPVFLSKGVVERGWARVVGENHLKCDLIDPKFPARIYPAIGFNLGEYLAQISNKKEFNVCYTIEENEWNGKVTLQLNLKDVRV
ncbi:MAG TPA: single-stranded-DNA-specific exonuclease RecJ, partial [Bacteroidia bacterium]|nr:single-stranded-DNA-specific exonuclease RecJ [Bacteroidia bacterium]